jgi:uncharacterized protein (TIGR02611 family)
LAAEQPPAAARAPTANGRNGMHHHVMRFGKRVAIAIAGGVVVLVGAAMLVLPGPGIVVILLGLGVLSLEFEPPRVWLAHLKARAVELKHRIDARRSQRRDG